MPAPVETESLRSHAENMERLTGLWRSAIDAVPLPLAVIRGDYSIARANACFADNAGLSVREISGRHCYTALFGRNEPCVGCPLPEALEKGGAATRLLEIKDRTVRVTAHAFGCLGEGGPVGLCLYDDETHRQRAAAMVAAEERLALLGQLSAGVAHEMNSPLAAILISAQTLQSIKRPAEELTALDIITRSARQAQRIVGSLQRIASGATGPERKERIEISRVIQEALTAASPMLNDRTVELQLGSSLPTLLAQRASVAEAVLHLIASAAVGAGPFGRVRIEATADSAHVFVTIEDEGLARKNGHAPLTPGKTAPPLFSSRAAGEMLGISFSRNLLQRLGGHLDRAPSRFPQGVALQLRFPTEQA